MGTNHRDDSDVGWFNRDGINFSEMLTVKNLNVGYKDSLLIQNINFSENDGALVALIGRNGTGKSTFLRSIVGLNKPLSGDIEIDGVSIFSIKPNQRAQLIAFVSTETSKVAHLQVCDVVAMGRSPYNSFTGILSDNDKKIVLDCIEKVGMSAFTNVNIDRLSDGERQRVIIARALAQESKMIVLDEPTAFLDLPNRINIIKLLKKLAHGENGAGKLILLSTHELNLACDIADKLWIVHNKELVRGTSNDDKIKITISQMLNNTSL